MDEIKYMVIYMDNSCEVHFNCTNDDESSRMIVSPCGSEFVYRTYSDNNIKTSFKYRTAYPISIFSNKLNILLKERNKYCNDRPFISPILLESFENNYWFSAENLSESTWEINDYIVKTLDKNPIEIDYHNFFYIWKSKCKNAELRLHFNKVIAQVKYPVKVPISANDEYELKCDVNLLMNKKTQSKHLAKYTTNEEEFSVNHLPARWQELHKKMIELIDLMNDKKLKPDSISIDPKEKTQEIKVKFQEAMPLSCSSTHLHKFDEIETSSEPKLIYLNQTYYKLFYKNKSIEVFCPSESGSESGQHYLVSDTLTGKYWTLFSLNKRNGEIEEQKICVENIPSFKTQIRKSLNYANILLKRIDSIKFISNFSTCYVNKKLEQLELSNDENFDDKLNRLNNPSISIDNIGKNSESTNTSIAESLITSKLPKNEVKKQYVIQDVGHFKYLINKTIIINFIDKAKLYMDDYSLDMYLNNRLDKCFCLLYLPDNSQHEICLSEKLTLTEYFLNYINFLEQWIKWLLDSSCIKKVNADDKKPVLTKTPTKSELNFSSLQAHISQLKLFNYSISQEINNSAEPASSDQDSSLQINNMSFLSVNNLLKENSKFLQNISK